MVSYHIALFITYAAFLTPSDSWVKLEVQNTRPIKQSIPNSLNQLSSLVVTVAFFPIVLRASMKGDVKTNWLDQYTPHRSINKSRDCIFCLLSASFWYHFITSTHFLPSFDILDEEVKMRPEVRGTQRE